MKKEIYVDYENLNEIKRDTERILSKCPTLVGLIKDAGFDVAKDIITDCVTMKKTTIPGDEIPSNYVGIDKEIQTKIYESVTIFVGCSQLDEAFHKRLEQSLKGIVLPSLRKQLENTAIAEYNAFRNKVVNLFPYDADMSFFLSVFEIEDGQVVLPKDINRQYKLRATVYCETQAAADAMELHEKAVESLNAFLKMFPKYVRPDDLNTLFNVIDGKVEIAPINYNKYL